MKAGTTALGRELAAREKQVIARSTDREKRASECTPARPMACNTLTQGLA